MNSRRRRKSIKTISSNHKGNPTALLTADHHIRQGKPICRTDNYEAAILKKHWFMLELCREHSVPLISAGDFGEKSYYVKEGNGWGKDISSKIVHLFMEYPDVDKYIVPGNHDLPSHSMENFDESPLGILCKTKVLSHLKNDVSTILNFRNQEIALYGNGWKEEVPVIGLPYEDDSFRDILVIHKMIIENKPLWPGQEAPSGNKILKDNPDFDLIVSGDNHNPFTAEKDGRLLVNCGSVMRTRTDQANYKPACWLYYAESNTVEKVYLPIEDSVINADHIGKKKVKAEQLESYSAMVEANKGKDLQGFKEIIQINLDKEDIPDAVKNKIEELIS